MLEEATFLLDFLADIDVYVIPGNDIKPYESHRHGFRHLMRFWWNSEQSICPQTMELCRAFFSLQRVTLVEEIPELISAPNSFACNVADPVATDRKSNDLKT